jgi:hypothetical protein
MFANFGRKNPLIQGINKIERAILKIHFITPRIVACFQSGAVVFYF